MSTVTPPPPSPPPAGGPPPAPVVTVAKPPPAIANLAVGAQIKAMVAATQAKAQLVLETTLGRMQLQTQLPLPDKANLTLSVQHQGKDQTQFRITAIDGRPPQQVLAQLRPGQAAAAPPAPGFGGQAAGGQAAAGQAQAPGPQVGASGGLPFVSLTEGTTVSATLLRPAPGLVQGTGLAQPGAGAHPQGPPAVPPAAGQPPAPGQGGTPQAPPAGGGQAGATPGATAGGEAGRGHSGAAGQQGGARAVPGQGTSPATGQSPPPLPAGSQMSLRIVAMQAPQGSGAAFSPGQTSGLALGQGQVLQGTVTGTTASGQPVVATQAGDIALATRSPVPQGSSVTLELRGVPQPPPPEGGQQAFATTAARAADPTLARQWPALEEAAKALHDSGSAQAQQSFSQAVPRPDGGLASGMLFFLNALRGGDLRGLLGDGVMRAIERARPGLTGRLGEEFRDRGRRADEVRQGDWKVAPMPVQTGEGMEQIRLMTRHHPDETEDGGSGGTRFVVDLTLTRLGHLQLDGLVAKDHKRLDLIVRTEAALDADVRDGIRRRFGESLEVVGLQGSVGFQAGPDSLMEIPAADAGGPSPGLVV